MFAEAKFWNDIAEKYAAGPVKDVAAFERKKAITREHLRPGGSVLELGCGTGSLALELAAFAGHIHALDISSEMIRIANAKKHAQGVTNVSFRQGSFDDCAELAAERFTCAWAYSVLHLVADRRRALETIFDLLAPGASFISSNVCLGGSWVPYRPLIALMHWLEKAPRVYIYDRETILREIREAGFIEVKEVDVGAEKTVAFIVAKKPERVPTSS
jgi:ubiquinone/menaquinone biosynthesis C-methylase UbiE